MFSPEQIKEIYFRARHVPEEEIAFPAPSVTSADGHEVPVKRGVTDLMVAAGKLGWSCRTTYAKGCAPHALTGKPLAERESIAVRMHKPGSTSWACAVYRAGSSVWSWDTMYVNGVSFKDLTTFKEAL